MPAALWKIALGSFACAVNAPAKPMPRAPCSKMAKPAARAGAGAIQTATARAAPRARLRLRIEVLLITRGVGTKRASRSTGEAGRTRSCYADRPRRVNHEITSGRARSSHGQEDARLQGAAGQRREADEPTHLAE